MAAAATTALGDLRPVYKKLLRLAKTLPEGKRETTLAQIRTEFRARRDVTDPKECVRSFGAVAGGDDGARDACD